MSSMSGTAKPQAFFPTTIFMTHWKAARDESRGKAQIAYFPINVFIVEYFWEDICKGPSHVLPGLCDIGRIK